MAHLISFKSAKFDVSAETPNPINPIAGERVLLWLRSELQREGFEVTEPDPEDWGWYVLVESGDASYLVGASADVEDPQAAIDWIVQIHRQRSFKDKLLGRNKLSPDDRLSLTVERVIRAGAGASDITVARDT